MYWNDFVSIMLTALAMTIAMVVSGIVVAVVYGRVMSQSFNKTSYKAAEATDGVRFADVLGVDEAKREAQEIVYFLHQAD
jgi:ATP-dependent Zn protease